MTVISLRSNRAHALASGSAALTRLMKSCGSPFDDSYRLNASNGLARITPPKSKNTALITVDDSTITGRMTTKTANSQHVVVDGSNIATEGRSMPSLAQLNEAVNSYIADHPGVTVTVVVDATFGHRIAQSEVKEFDAAIANNELVAPPAGAIGRGDAFVLSIAKKAKATILSNDSFQEFHGEHDWLFDDGRLIGGKPVPHVGWVWVAAQPGARADQPQVGAGLEAAAGPQRGCGRRSQGRS